uniref:Uncharacterized protein n=1 Tax=Arundo donax TaxID=35708 RepID=A0A0A8YC89_ARUDO
MRRHQGQPDDVPTWPHLISCLDL